MRREASRGSWKFSAQMILVSVLALVHTSRFQGAKEWLGLAPPPLPACPPPKWWQRALPWLKPGAQGECRADSPGLRGARRRQRWPISDKERASGKIFRSSFQASGLDQVDH